MPLIITAEHLDLAPDQREKYETCLRKILSRSSRISNLRLYLKRLKSDLLEATLVIHYNQQDISYTEKGRDLDSLVRSASSHVLRRLAASKRRRLDARKKRVPFQATG